METVKVLQVVGFKNSGKTTLVLDLLKQANDKGKSVSTIKRHGHDGELDMPQTETDSMRFFTEGANSSVVYGGGVIQLHQRKEQATLDELIVLTSLGHPDYIFIEGFKEARFEKVVLLRSADEWLQLQSLQHISLVITQEVIELDNIPVILQNDSKQLREWFTNWMDGDRNEGV
ncbi:molybdopterin-guanine dinucleotide biosynthesis protein B [Planococcus kocurii]|uniref:Molybdopterin-guanine dinucleotide biosynthesis protein MobB n=1 Tax=Planococcus kocurii TaxID=1374 RepID=A0ABM5WWF0_9BACL|nr:molybdopterin-guanine dinucleotide biosynthesis protein B [Planococcus kocurii]ALS78662.1 molybdopterin-guanine dinucleotide biosynthesis protein MobB [Planococcus kocurii]